jgi:hypothetical protein
MLLSAWLATSTLTAGGPASFISSATVANPEMQKKLELAKAYESFLKQVGEKAAAYRQHEMFQQKIRDYPAGEKISAFLTALDKQESKGVDVAALMRSLSQQRKNAATISGLVGGITGTVLVEGEVSFETMDVLAFDRFGFPAGIGPVFAGAYEISGLAPGDYYVVTRSPFVDEFYNNAPSDFARGWRDATLVTVPEEGNAADINFDLDRGALLSGTIYRADDESPIGDAAVDFELFDVTDPVQRFSIFSVAGEDGVYEIVVPATGQFIIRASVENFIPQFFENAATREEADSVLIATLEDVVTGIDFRLTEISAPPVAEGGKIRGTVLGAAEEPAPLALVFAFDLADTSVAALQIAGEDGTYEISGLREGHSYIIFANHILEFIFPILSPGAPAPSFRGEYYQDAEDPANATQFTFTATDTLFEGVDFTLEPGGDITGTITNTSGAPLDSVIVVAIKTTILNGIGCLLQGGGFCAEDLDLSIAISDTDGNYLLPGLSSGEYYLRTLSLLNPNIGDILGGGSLIGKHAGQVLDEYYQDVYSIFDIAAAQPVPVAAPNPTSGINFVLEAAGGISGQFVEFSDGAPVQGEGIVIAFNAETGLPELAFDFDAEPTSYLLRPLPPGNFKLLGIVNNQPIELPANSTQSNGVIYVPQFYDGQPTFELADEVAVVPPGDTPDIDFKMIRAGGLFGVVNLPSGNPVGADSLFATIVVAFEANTGVVAGVADVTFAGGYRIVGAPPGDYKVMALVGASDLAATYHDGSATFDAAGTVSVTPDAVSRVDITLNEGFGVISGAVRDLGDNPLPGVLVLAYDLTGHVVSVGISGFDLQSGLPLLSPDEYHIPGLVAGNYYVRTFALFRLLQQLQEGGLGDQLGGDPLGTLLGLLLAGGGDLLDNLTGNLFADLWYDGVPVPLALDRDDIFGLLFNLLLGSGDIQFALPLFDLPAEGAAIVSVGSPGERGGVNFKLPTLRDVLTDVSEQPGGIIPTAFELSQNYPNPFNPSTAIRFSLPQSSDIRLAVYNMLGQRVRILFEGRKAAGVYSAVWDGANERGEVVAAGLYFVRLESQANNVALTRKIVFVK